MKITKVSLDGNLDTFGGRALIIQTDKGSYKTPQRVLTSSEIQYKAKLPFEPPINNEFSEIVAQFSTNQWQSFMETNGSFASRYNILNSFNDKMAYTTRKFFPQIPQSIAIDTSAIKQILELQRMSELDFITMPSLPSDMKVFPKLASGFSEEVLSEKREPLIYLDMALNESIFQQRFNDLLEFAKTGLVRTIGLIYRPIPEYSKNYLVLWENRETEVLLQMSDIPRIYKDTTATMHLLQKWGIDMFSVRMSRFGGSGGESEPEKSEIIPKVKRFDSKPMMFKSFQTWAENDHPLDCRCAICQDMHASEFVEKYWGDSEDYPGQTFNAATRLHEYYKSTEEFKEGRKYIREGSLIEYFKAKDGLRRSDVAVPGKMAKLNGFY